MVVGGKYLYKSKVDKKKMNVCFLKIPSGIVKKMFVYKPETGNAS